MRKPDGYSIIIDPGGNNFVQEFDNVTCIHCGQISMTRSGTTGKLECLVFRADGAHHMREAGFCRNCYHHICPRCDGKPCVNRFRKLDGEEAAARRLICS
jgi:hypothetical protein